MMTAVMAIGTRKGIWLARSEDRASWDLSGPWFGAYEVAAVAIDTRPDRPRVLATVRSEWWGTGLVDTDDLGTTWGEPDLSRLAFPADTGAALHRIWHLAPDRSDRPGVVWAGVEPTSLWRSDDGGRSFELVRGLWDHPHRPEWGPGYGGAAVHTIVPARDSSRVTIAMSTGGVYVSEDGSTDWMPRNRGIRADFAPDPLPEFGQCVHRVAADASSDDVLYAQNHGGVYRSDDAGVTWSSIAEGLPSDFGFVMLADPRRTGTLWVVPIDGMGGRVPPGGRLRVHRSDDGGRTWTEHGHGLPDASWTAVLRDAACLDQGDPTGVHLGTRDGSVYSSADGAETFVTVAEHLPDVLSVRAAVFA